MDTVYVPPEVEDMYVPFVTSLLEANPQGLTKIYEFSSDYFERKIKERAGERETAGKLACVLSRDLPISEGNTPFQLDFSYDSVLEFGPTVSLSRVSWNKNIGTLLSKEKQIRDHLEVPIAGQQQRRIWSKDLEIRQVERNDPPLIDPNDRQEKQDEVQLKDPDTGKKDKIGSLKGQKSPLSERKKIQMAERDDHQERPLKDFILPRNQSDISEIIKQNDSSERVNITKLEAPDSTRSKNLDATRREENQDRIKEKEKGLTERKRITGSEKLGIPEQSSVGMDALLASGNPIENSFVELSQLLSKCIEVMDKALDKLAEMDKDPSERKEKIRYMNLSASDWQETPDRCPRTTDGPNGKTSDKETTTVKKFRSVSSQTDFIGSSASLYIDSTMVSSPAMFQFVNDVIRSAYHLLQETDDNCYNILHLSHATEETRESGNSNFERDSAQIGLETSLKCIYPTNAFQLQTKEPSVELSKNTILTSLNQIDEGTQGNMDIREEKRSTKRDKDLETSETSCHGELVSDSGIIDVLPQSIRHSSNETDGSIPCLKNTLPKCSGKEKSDSESSGANSSDESYFKFNLESRPGARKHLKTKITGSSSDGDFLSPSENENRWNLLDSERKQVLKRTKNNERNHKLSHAENSLEANRERIKDFHGNTSSSIAEDRQTRHKNPSSFFQSAPILSRESGCTNASLFSEKKRHRCINDVYPEMIEQGTHFKETKGTQESALRTCIGKEYPEYHPVVIREKDCFCLLEPKRCHEIKYYHSERGKTMSVRGGEKVEDPDTTNMIAGEALSGGQHRHENTDAHFSGVKKTEAYSPCPLPILPTNKDGSDDSNSKSKHKTNKNRQKRSSETLTSSSSLDRVWERNDSEENSDFGHTQNKDRKNKHTKKLSKLRNPPGLNEDLNDATGIVFPSILQHKNQTHEDSIPLLVSTPVKNEKIPRQLFITPLKNRAYISTGNIIHEEVSDDPKRKIGTTGRSSPEDQPDEVGENHIFFLLDPRRSCNMIAGTPRHATVEVVDGQMSAAEEAEDESPKLVCQGMHRATSLLQMRIKNSRKTFKEEIRGGCTGQDVKSLDYSWNSIGVPVTGRSWLRSYLTIRMTRRYQKMADMESQQEDEDIEDLATPVLKHREEDYGLRSYFASRSLFGSVRMWYFAKKIREYERVEKV